MCVLLFLDYFHGEIYVLVVRPDFVEFLVYRVHLFFLLRISICLYILPGVTFQYFAHIKWVLYNSSFSFCFFTIQKFWFLGLLYVPGYCYSDVLALSVNSIGFDAEVFWYQMLGFAGLLKIKWLLSFSVNIAWCFCSCRFLAIGPLLF